MKAHTTNYSDVFIEVAVDCPVSAGTVPPVKGDKRTVAHIQFEMIRKHPYRFTSDDVVFGVYAEKNGLTEAAYSQARQQFFSKGQPCLRTSPLCKRYGWGIHSDSKGRIALYGRETEAYTRLMADEQLKKVKAMRSAR